MMRETSLDVRQTFVRFALLLAVSICILGEQSPGQAAESTATTERAQVERWRYLLGSFPPASMAFASEEEKARVAEDFLTTDVSQMPPEWRYAFLKVRLVSYQTGGKWDEMLAVRDELMKAQEPDPGRSPLDADILCQVARYFDGVVFFPPHDHATSSLAEIGDYYETHYRNRAEAKRIYEYILNHFDSRYVKTVEALNQLAYLHLSEGGGRAPLESFKRFEALNLDEVYSVDRIHTGRKLLQKAADHREEALRILRRCRENLPYSMIIVAQRLRPKEEAIRELSAIAQRYREDEKVQAKAQEILRSMFGVEDIGVK